MIDGVSRRTVVVPLNVPSWCPPGVEPRAWRYALAEDVVDLLATLAELTPAIAVVPADRAVAEAVSWPGTRVYELPALAHRAGRVRPARPGPGGLGGDPGAAELTVASPDGRLAGRSAQLAGSSPSGPGLSRSLRSVLDRSSWERANPSGSANSSSPGTRSG